MKITSELREQLCRMQFSVLPSLVVQFISKLEQYIQQLCKTYTMAGRKVLSSDPL
jgi:hypothetical protein